jgi:hypothetical protein
LQALRYASGQPDVAPSAAKPSVSPFPCVAASPFRRVTQHEVQTARQATYHYRPIHDADIAMPQRRKSCVIEDADLLHIVGSEFCVSSDAFLAFIPRLLRIISGSFKKWRESRRTHFNLGLDTRTGRTDELWMMLRYAFEISAN